MDSRRDFLKLTGAALPIGAASLFLATGSDTLAGDADKVASVVGKLPNNIIYTKANEGVWKGKSGSHVPTVALNAGKVSIFTKHGMSAKHFIVRHTLVNAKGEVIFGNTFAATDKEAKSVFEGTKVKKGEKYYALSYCNKHDLWLSEVTI